MTNSRAQWLDLAKGAGICLVVAYHCVEGILNSFTPVAQAIEWLANYFRSWLMPMFFVVSGMLVRKSMLSADNAKLRNKLFDWCYLYVLWSVIIYLTRLLSNSFTNTTMQANEILFILWDPVPTIWFIYALLLSFATTILLRHQSPWLILPLALAANLANAAFFGWFEDSIFQRFAWIYLFYAVGFCFAAPLKQWVANTQNSFTWLCAFLVMSVLIAYAKPWVPFYLLPFVSLLLVAGFLKSCFAVSQWLAHSRVMQFGVYVGSISLFIYLTHFPLPAATRMLLLKLDLYSHTGAMLLAVLLAVGVGTVASKLANKVPFSWLFAPPKRPTRPSSSTSTTVV